MRAWSGLGTFQWEHTRRWELASAGSEYTRAEGALLVPGGFDSFSFFFRRASATVGTFELFLWTAPVFFKPLDEAIDDNTAESHLFKLVFDQPTSMQFTGTTAKVFGGRLKANQPMGCLLFWQMKNTGGAAGSIVGDLYIVANHSGTMTLPRIGRTIDDVTSPIGGPPSLHQLAAGGRNHNK